MCLLTAFVIILGFHYIRQLIAGGNAAAAIGSFFKYSFWTWFKSTLTGLTIGTIIFMIIIWQESLLREQKLREENLIFQNETLKTQVNPHFLFNSLNTLSSLIESQSELSKIFLHKLASTYRYILENGNKDKVALKNELEFITDYFDLHRIRGEGKIFLNISVPDSENLWILPVSLQILLENAIKHNMATRESPLKISVFNEGEYIVVKNNLQQMSYQSRSTHIGLKNLDERVKLVTGKPVLIIRTSEEFIVKVPLLS